ncbi:hypothetical protein NCS55_00213200 [Fusarium keratoplasticum]|nr:hypothetical protein NCS55_00213200 [Fusarium keratoplasticum]
MFVYQGKLNWYHYGVDETFVIVLPNGPVRVGDSVYLFSQWTVDAQGNKKRNWFDTIIVDSVTQTQATDVTFYLKGAWYNYAVTTEGGYKSLSVVMRNPTNGVSKPMPLQRIWESEQELTGTTRIWTGKFSWMHFAKDEPAIFIVPDGFGEGKPILSLWQYTQDSAGKLKDPSFRNAVQKSVSGIGTDVVKFSYHSYYDISCTWEAKTDKLAVHVKEGSHGEDVGSMIRSAIIERQAHTHDFDPPEPTPGKTEVEVRLPQPQPSLPRILGPLPFPKGIIDTLAHTAAFVDQAGYLAKYAQDRFAALDADYHTLLRQLDAAKASIKNLTKAKEDLTLDRDGARAKAEKLEEDLAKTRKEADELRKTIEELRHDIYKDKIQDEEARKILQDTQDKLTASQAEVSDLKQKLSKAQGEIEDLNARIGKLLDKVIEQQTDISRLETELDVQTKKNAELTKEYGQLKSANSELEASKNKTQGLLDRANKRIEELEQTVKDQQGDIDNLIKEKDDAQSKVSAAQKARAKAESDLAALKKKAYDAGIDF